MDWMSWMIYLIELGVFGEVWSMDKAERRARAPQPQWGIILFSSPIERLPEKLTSLQFIDGDLFIRSEALRASQRLICLPAPEGPAPN